jgi:F-type H+-transporting ATPase subunit gamma
MKMVAASKLRTATEQLEISRRFQRGLVQAWPEPAEAPELKEGKTTYVVMTSDRGLCGGVNTQILRQVRPALRASSKSAYNLFTIGDKGRSALEREFSDNFVECVSEVGKVKRLTFKQTAMVADVLNAVPFASAKVVYNNFVSSQSSTPTIAPIYPVETMLQATDITTKYENEGTEELYQNLWEFRNAARLFNYSAESYASETASRMNAMSSSSKNAAEMLSAISLEYNRRRQAKITSELIEIISGAAAAEAQAAAAQ